LPAHRRPYSRGTLRLADAAPETPPVIDRDYYTDGRDVDAVAAGLRLARDIGAAAALREWRGEEVPPGPDRWSSAELRDYVRATMRSYHHYVGTCRLGTDNDAVVDLQLRVRGIAGLRVPTRRCCPRSSRRTPWPPCTRSPNAWPICCAPTPDRV
jgi:choline dehydrogenase